MDTYKETFITWDKVAEQYQEMFMDLDIYNDTYDEFCNLITGPQPTILEIGCGPGNISKYILKKLPDVQLLGTDVSQNMIDLAKKNNPTATFINLDARNIHKIQSNYQGIISGFTLPYLSAKDIEHIVSKFYELLLKNGILYLSYVEGEPSNSGFLTGKDGDRVFFYYHNSTDIINILKLNYFKVLKHHKITYRKKDGSTEIHTVIISVKS